MSKSIIESRSPIENVIIKASAGTGKTFQLASRYLLLLFSGVRPENILATTFTKKAAGEILDRILSWLAKGAIDEESCQTLVKILNMAKKKTQPKDKSSVSLDLKKDVRPALYEVIKNLNRVNVSTLDSYFNQRVHCFSLELELPMDWDIIDESLDDRYRQAVISQLFQKEKFAKIYSSYIRVSDLKRSIYDQMSDTVTEMYDLWREAPPEAWEALEVPKFKKEEFFDLIDQTVNLFDSRRTTLTGNQKPLTEGQTESICNALRSLDPDDPRTISAYLETTLPKNVWSVRKTPKEGVMFSGKLIVDPDIVKNLIQIVEDLRAVLIQIKRTQTDVYRESLEMFDELYMDYKKKQGRLMFADIPWFLVEKNAVDNDTDAFRMDSSIQHLMLDEFQDTSMVQWRVLQSLARHTAADDNCSFFCVGDVKQAIYGWRGGEARLLKEMKDLLQLPDNADINEIEMQESYRSGQSILDAVNKVFMELGDEKHDQFLLKNDDPQTFLNGAQKWRGSGADRFPEHVSYNPKLESYVKLYTAPFAENATDEDKADADSLKMMAYEHVASMIEKDLIKRAKECDLTIGVLVRKKTEGEKIANCIKDRGLECSLEGTSILLDSCEVCQILALMKWIDHPEDMYSYYQVCNSPLVQELERAAKELKLKFRKPDLDQSSRLAASSDDYKILNRLRYELYCNGYGLTVQRWADLLKPSAKDRNRRRLELLVDLANKYDSQGSTRTEDFIDYVNGSSVEDVYQSRIRVMTYHKSKGLDFDIVILPQLDAPLVINDHQTVVFGHLKNEKKDSTAQESDVLQKPDAIIGSFLSKHRYLMSEDMLSKKLLPKELLPKDPQFLQKLYTNQEEKDVQEAFCNLYVAMTRARQGLYMVLPPQKTGSHHTYEDVLLGMLTDGVTRKTKEAGKTYYESGNAKWLDNVAPKVKEETTVTEVSGAFEFNKKKLAENKRSICIPLPASAWTTNAKPSSFVNVVTAEVNRLESGSSLSQSTRGTLFHCWLADIEWLAEYRGDDQRLTELGIGIGLQQDSFTGLLPAFKSLLKHPNVIATLERPDDAWETYREKNVAGILEEDKRKYLVSGVIDRLTVHRNADGKVDKAIVLDFKTVRKGSDISAVRARYAGQMDAYRQIVSKMYGIPVRSVETTLLVLEGDF